MHRTAADLYVEICKLLNIQNGQVIIIAGVSGFLATQNSAL